MTEYEKKSTPFFPLILSKLHVESRSGQLEVVDESTTYTLTLEKGRIMALSSTNSKESLSKLIIQSGQISPWDMELAQEAVDTNKGRALGSLLVDMGLVQQELVIEQLNKKLEQTLSNLFQNKKVDVLFKPEEVAVTFKILPTKTTADLILNASRSMDSPLVIDRVLSDPEKYLRLSRDVRLRYQQATTTRLEKTILHHAEKGPRIGQILESDTQADRMELLKSIFGLIVAGLIEVSNQPPQRDSLSIPAEESEFTLTRGMVVDKFKEIGIQDSDEFLELPKGATPQDIRRHYETLLSLYHPDQSSRETLVDLTPQLEAIFLELTHCYNLITRKENRKSVPIPEKKKPEEVVSDTQVRIKTASTNYQYALKMLNEQRLGEAMSAIQMSVDNEPGNAFYLFKMGQILRRVAGRQKEAELSYRRALDLDPLSTDIMSDLASLYWENGMKAKANTIMKQAFSFDPSNKRLQKFWMYLQSSDRTFPLKEILILVGGITIGLLVAVLM